MYILFLKLINLSWPASPQSLQILNLFEHNSTQPNPTQRVRVHFSSERRTSGASTVAMKPTNRAEQPFDSAELLGVSAAKDEDASASIALGNSQPPNLIFSCMISVHQNQQVFLIFFHVQSSFVSIRFTKTVTAQAQLYCRYVKERFPHPYKGCFVLLPNRRGIS